MYLAGFIILGFCITISSKSLSPVTSKSTFASIAFANIGISLLSLIFGYFLSYFFLDWEKIQIYTKKKLQNYRKIMQNRRHVDKRGDFVPGDAG